VTAHCFSLGQSLGSQRKYWSRNRARQTQCGRPGWQLVLCGMDWPALWRVDRRHRAAAGHLGGVLRMSAESVHQPCPPAGGTPRAWGHRGALGRMWMRSVGEMQPLTLRSARPPHGGRPRSCTTASVPDPDPGTPELTPEKGRPDLILGRLGHPNPGRKIPTHPDLIYFTARGMDRSRRRSTSGRPACSSWLRRRRAAALVPRSGRVPSCWWPTWQATVG
jgi:hypothetical protein